MMRLLILFFFWSAGAQAISPEIVKQIELQTPEFESVLKKSSKAQSRLIIERYVNLLALSPATQELKVDRLELKEYLFKKFEKLLVENSKTKPEKAPQFSKLIESDIQKLLKAFDGEFRNGKLQLKFPCQGEIYELPFKIEPVGPVAFDMVLEGVSLPDTLHKTKGEMRCLNLFMLAKNQPASLSLLGTIDAACPLPPQGAGNCLLEVADNIVRASGRTRIGLRDGSKVQCPSSRERVSLWQLRIYQKKPTWYESKGYRVVKNTEQYQARVKLAQSYMLEDLLTNIDGLEDLSRTGYSEEHNLLLRFVKLFEVESVKGSVADFMAWLWDKDCSAYAKINELITLGGEGIKFAEMMPGVSDLEKELH